MNLVTVGTLALDSVRTPQGKLENGLGGSATFFGLASSFFTECGVIGVVGEDFPPEHLDFLKSKKINLEGVETQDGKTFHWEGEYLDDMNEAHTKKTDLNVLETFDPKIPENYIGCDVLFLANIDPDIQLKVLDTIKPKICFCDTMNFWIDIKKESLQKVFERVDGIIINDGEAKQFCETNNLVNAGRKLNEINDGKIIIKKGVHGAMFFGDEIFSIPAYPIADVVDPTGCGDSFAGGAMGYIASQGAASDEIIRKAIVYGSSIASHVVTDFSIDGVKNKKIGDIKGRFKEFKKLVDF